MKNISKTIQTTIDLPDELHKKIAVEAKRQGRSRHQQMLFVLDKFFKEKEENERWQQA